jgi:hypothetical protein
MNGRAALAVAATVCAWSHSTAKAHEWYPAACCSQRDCRHLEESKGETVMETPAGWRLWDGRVVARGAAKLSPDNLFHLCERRDRSIACFYAPPGSS